MADRKEQTPILHKKLPVPAARLYNYKENAENLSPNLRQVEQRQHEFLHSDLNSKSKPLPQVRHSVSPAKPLPKEGPFCENHIGQDGLNSKPRLSTDHLHCEEDAGVKVIVRIRPLSEKEVLEDATSMLYKTGDNSFLLGDQHYTFDAVAEHNFNQQAIFEMVGRPMVEHCLSGFNGSIFAYGQTGSGKTYTMWGKNYENSGDQLGEDVGLVPRILDKLFLRILEEEEKHINKDLKYKCRCSVLEIFNEQIQDLLEPSQTNLQIREDTKAGVYVDNLTEENISNITEAMNLLIKGLSNRKVGTTAMNFESSRSHCVFTCVVECQYKNISDGTYSTRSSKINLVDLAGSERQKRTGAIGERLREAGNTNRSLTQLGNVINTLADLPKSARHRHIPYRNSRLTFLLQESLGGNAKLAMICAVSSANSCKEETVGTLRFAQRAKKIQNKAVINEETTIDTKFLRDQICQLKNELSKVKLIGCHSELNNTGSTGASSMHPAIKDKECTDIEVQGYQSNAQFDGCKNCAILQNGSNLPSEEKKELQDDIEDELLEELVYLHGGSEIPLGASMLDAQICDEENDKLDPADPFSAESIVISVDENGIRFVSQQKLDKTSTIKKLQVDLESCAYELESEKRYSKEIQEALKTAMAGHVKLLEQYSELQEKYDALLVQQRSISKNMIVNGTVVMLDQSASSVRATRHQSFDYFEPKVAEIEELVSMLKEEETSATRAKDSAASIAQEADTMCREVERLQKLHAKSMVICKELLKTQSHIHGTCPMCTVARRVQFKFLDQD